MNRNLALLALLTWLVAFALLLTRPTAALDKARGLYRQEGAEQTYRWTGSRVTVPIRGHSGPTTVDLGLNTALWQGRTPPRVQLATPRTTLATFTVTNERRHYRVILPAGTQELLLHSQVDRPPPGAQELRWLGVKLHTLIRIKLSTPLWHPNAQ
jgi:hypothetical protein